MKPLVLFSRALSFGCVPARGYRNHCKKNLSSSCHVPSQQDGQFTGARTLPVLWIRGNRLYQQTKTLLPSEFYSWS